MPLVVAGGREVHVQSMGEGDPLVLVHGLVFGNLSSWYLTVGPRLAARRRVVVYDLRGHGRSEPAATGYDLATTAGDLGDLLDAIEIEEPVDLGGHSFGGAIPLFFALRAPERVRRLVVVDAPLPPFDPEDLKAFTSMDPEEALATLPDPADVAEGPDWRKRIGERQRRLRRDRFARFRDETTVGDDLRTEPALPEDGLAALAIPTLLVYGADSPFLPTGEALARTLPDARLVVLDGGHLLPVEKPAATARAIEAFLGG